MNDWNIITSEEDFYALLDKSATHPQVIFKDSVTCGISAYAKERLKEGYGLIAGKADFHYLDLLALRPVSNLIARELEVTHQSPQVIVVRNRKAVYVSTHHSIDPAKIAAWV